jgi:hypothetical protein
VEAARDYVSGGANLRGAAVVAALLVESTGSYYVGKPIVKPLADAWVTEHGLAFAACAFVELSGLRWGERGIGAVEDQLEGYRYTVGSTRLPLTGARLRGLLAAASDGEYREAVDRLAEHRRTPAQRLAVSFLVPDRHDWVEECLAAPPNLDHDLGTGGCCWRRWGRPGTSIWPRG